MLCQALESRITLIQHASQLRSSRFYPLDMRQYHGRTHTYCSPTMPQNHVYLPLLYPHNPYVRPRVPTLRAHASMYQPHVPNAHVSSSVPFSRPSDQRRLARPRYQVQTQIALQRRPSHRFCLVKPRVARDVGAGQKPRQPTGHV
jgi:hypothetical protein